MYQHLSEPPKDLFKLTRIEILTLFGVAGHAVVLTFAPTDENSEIAPYSLKFSRPDYPKAIELARYYQEKYS